jgi:hypothetical protein
MTRPDGQRVLKTAWFSKAARKAGISDRELCAAIEQVMLGQAADLGGGVFKKRLDRNRSRAIILAKAGRWWVYEYLFAKKDRENIGIDELTGFKRLAKSYGALSEQQVNLLIREGDWTEICDGDQKEA